MKYFDIDLKNEKERPLEKLLPDGGLVGIFRTLAVIGDSLSSGEFEGTNEEGNKTYHDLYEYSWGQYIARIAGLKVYNFSKGGMRADDYMNTFADDRGFWNRDLACQGYIVAMGANDIPAVMRGELEFGTLADIDMDNWRSNKKTFVGQYAAMLQRYREISPDSFFFLMTMPRSDEEGEREPYNNKHQALLYELARLFPRTYVLDFRQYAPVYDKEFYRNFGLGGHLSAAGYLLTAKMVISYMDYIIRQDIRAFMQIGFIGTPWKNTVDVD